MLYSAFLLVIAFEIISGQSGTNYSVPEQNALQQQEPNLSLCPNEFGQEQKCRDTLKLNKKSHQLELPGRKGKKTQRKPDEWHLSQRKHQSRQQLQKQVLSTHKLVYARTIDTSLEPTTVEHTREEITISETLESQTLGQITEHSPTSITFVASKKTANTVNITDWSNGGQFSHVFQLSPEFKIQNHYIKLGSKFTDMSIQPSPGLIHTVISAYKDHHNLVLTPDDVWSAIMIQFSRYVNANAKQLRHLFVSHEGKITLKFPVNQFVDFNEDRSLITERAWKRAIDHFRLGLKIHSKPQFADFVENNFTTTTERTRMVSGLTFMSAMKHYFKFEFEIICGIPRITLLGTVDDWVDISNRVRLLRQFGSIPSKWADLLSPIISQFVNAKRGEVDGEFWGDIVRIQKNYGCGRGQPADILNGWLTAFAVFDGKGKWRGDKLPNREWPSINMKHVSSGVVTVPIQLNWPNLAGYASTQDAIVFVGHMGHEVSIDRKTLTPYAGWGVASIKIPSNFPTEKPASFSSSAVRSRHRNYTRLML